MPNNEAQQKREQVVDLVIITTLMLSAFLILVLELIKPILQ